MNADEKQLAECIAIYQYLCSKGIKTLSAVKKLLASLEA